jgi:hypothetical protein
LIFLAPNGICAIGTIAEYSEKGPNHWTIEITNAKVLLQDLTPSEKPLQAAAKISAKITINLVTGLGSGIILSPEEDWIGRTVLFSATPDNDIYTVASFPLFALSPKGPFAVFTRDEESTISTIEQVAQILRLQSADTQVKELMRLIESETEPQFLRRFSLQQVARTARENPKLKFDLATQLRTWRDNEQFAPELRGFADDTLMENLPPQYASSEERLEFLHKLKDKPGVSEEIKELMKSRIDHVQRLKSSEVPAQ